MSKIPVFDIGDTLIPCYRLQNDLIRNRIRLESDEVPEFDVNKFRIYNKGEVDDYFKKYGIKGIEAEKVVREYKRREKRYLEREEIFQFLKKCSANYGKIGFISDNSIKGKEWLIDLLDEYKVPFEGFVVSEEVGVEKPKDEIFERFLDRREESPNSFVYIGNNVERDKAAEDVGMNFIWIDMFETFGSEYDGVKLENLDLDSLKSAIQEVETE